MAITSSKKILEAVITKLRDQNIGISITSQDIEEGFKRPSFFVSLENLKAENYMSSFQEKSGDIRIVFFPTHKHKNQEEVLDTQDLLSEIFLKRRRYYWRMVHV